ncbi:hypothetical protein T484DRAFT_3138214 [Baffinella frigidus]|nr:hypothetical protein T484DRAFT_3138214 [Cryptophyta sp. CCMP2293]
MIRSVSCLGWKGGEYTTRLWDTNDRLSYQKPGCDASKGGNEFRMINDFRGVPGAKGRNMRFSRCQVQGARAALIVAIKDVAEGEEFLLDYGEQYWGADSKPGPPQPGEPGYVAPPSAEDIARVEAELCEMLQQALED